MPHLEEEHAAYYIAAMHRIINRAWGLALFATGDFPSGFLHSLLIDEMIAAFEAHDKTHPEAVQGSQPRTTTIAAIKNTHHPLSKEGRAQAQELAVLIFLIAGQGSPRGPPSQCRQHRRALLFPAACQQQPDAVQPWHTNGSTR